MTKQEKKTLKIKSTFLKDGGISVENIGGNDNETAFFILNNARGLTTYLESHPELFQEIIENSYERLGHTYQKEENPSLLDLIFLNVLNYFVEDTSGVGKEIFLPIAFEGEIYATDLISEGNYLDISEDTTFSINVERKGENIRLYDIYEFFFSVTHNNLLIYILNEIESIFHEEAIDKNISELPIDFQKIMDTFRKVIEGIDEIFSDKSNLLIVAVYSVLLQVAQEALGDGLELTDLDKEVLEFFSPTE